jgi:uncharacterized membrane protein
MGEITEIVDVDVDVRTAYNQWTQFEEFPRFMEGVERVERLDDRRLRWEVEIDGVERTFDADITELTPNERIAWTSTTGPEQSGVVTFETLNTLGGDQTRVTLQMNFHPDGIWEQIGDKSGVLSARTKGDLIRFKEFVEDRGSETGA